MAPDNVFNTADEVFTPGREPLVTYNPRQELDIEGEVHRFLRKPGYVLTVSGPSKSGKTVLVEKIIPRTGAIWMTGAEIKSIDDFLNRIISHHQAVSEVTTEKASSKGAGAKIGVSAGIPKALQGSAELSGSAQQGSRVSEKRTIDKVETVKALLETHQTRIVVDDFHYVSDDLKIDLTRTIKEFIRFCFVVFIAVPQDAYDAVRLETDMNSRVWQLEIPDWTSQELLYISREGFKALGLMDPQDEIGNGFATESLGAPFLMQRLCLEYCIDNGYERERYIKINVAPLRDHQRFYSRVAKRHVPGVFDFLMKGPRTKGTARVARVLKSGEQTDIYGAILYAVSNLPPRRDIPLRMLTLKLSDVLTEGPRLSNVTSALGHLADIAEKNRGTSDATVAFKDDTLYLADPFLAFYLRHGNWKLPSLPEDSI